MEKFILLERDGVINVMQDAIVKTPDEFVFLPFVLEAFFELKQNQIRPIVLTNQPGLATGELEMRNLGEIHSKMISTIEESGGKVEDVLICPHDESKNCDCRYPKPGLLVHAAQKFKFDLKSTFFIGSHTACLQAAWQAGCKSSFVRSGKPYKTLQFLRTSDRQPDLITRDLLETVVKIMRVYQS
ncbi:MAG: HAD-IIIA family hydrolase [Candidatus Omnitrophota bacterium]|jgi:D-glycero-D-manno-heptose 1,7-bisphosphate phosphatase|nr:MAG: HAD-IIIA family hydrolase [Candidatus Omnitrophota bacterium]